jgi:hypothetical protein
MTAVSTQAQATDQVTLAIKVGSHTLPLKSALSKPKADGSQNTYWFLSTTDKMPYAGVLLPFLTEDGSIPSKVELVVTKGDEKAKVVPVPLTAGYTKTEDGSQGNLKGSRSGSFDVPHLGEKNLQVIISAPKSGVGHNVIIKVIGLGGGAGGGKKVAAFDDLF